ncbi:MAG: helix-turn-helix transcriptional regulator [Bacteroidetes bacterium]|nr:helix-turn-helix transcriptional regulator [Bacteroidota bacterium]MCW5896931.1 helix-turn-helix transcriptional regulator [Bacteroidota bacterium]
MRNKLKMFREAKGFSQEELGERPGASRQTITAIEREKYDPSLPLALEIGALIRKPVEQIFVDTDEK